MLMFTLVFASVLAAVVIGLPFAWSYGSIALRDWRERSEARELLIDLFEIEAQFPECWANGYGVLQHDSGSMRLSRQSTFRIAPFVDDDDYAINGQRLSLRGARAARRLLKEVRARREEHETLAELDRVTQALKRQNEEAQREKPAPDYAAEFKEQRTAAMHRVRLQQGKVV